MHVATVGMNPECRGIPLFTPPTKAAKLDLTGHKVYKTGIVLLEYAVK